MTKAISGFVLQDADFHRELLEPLCKAGSDIVHSVGNHVGLVAEILSEKITSVFSFSKAFVNQSKNGIQSLAMDFVVGYLFLHLVGEF